MKTFSYIAVDQDGRKIKKTVEAESKEDVIRQIYAANLTPLSVDEVIPWFSWQKLNEIEIGGIPLEDKVFFMKQFSVMLTAGLPITDVLDILSKQVDNKRLQKVFNEAKRKVASGTSLSSAFSEYPDVFDPIALALIKAGEESGNLEYVFRRLSKEYSEKHKITSKIKGALIYPAIILVATVLVVAFIMIFVVPEMKKAFISFNAKLPLLTRILIAISESLAKYFYVYIFGFIALILSIRYIIHTPSGKKMWDAFKLNIPILGKLHQQLEVVTFARVLQLLIASGVPILRALELTKQAMSNYWFKQEIDDIITVVKQGGSMAKRLLESEFFPPVVGYMVNVGQKTGKLDEVLKKLVNFYTVEIRETTRGLAASIQPIMILILGVIVGLIVVAIYFPLITLAQSIS